MNNNDSQQNFNNYVPNENMNPQTQNNFNPNQIITNSQNVNTFNSSYVQNTNPTGIIENEENILLGSIGALVGALIGGVSIYLFTLIDLISSLSGFLIALGALYGYKLLGHQLSKKGIIISSVIMVIASYLCYHTTFALTLAKIGYFSFFECFEMLFDLLEESGYTSNYWITYCELLAFCALGAFGVIRANLKQIKK